jgi:ABC-type Fe3+-hydroxamate transport system substrate-binding protein
VHIDIVKSLEPGLVIANKEENTKEQIEELATMYPVWTSDIQTIEQGLHMIGEVGRMTGKAEKAEQLATEIKTKFGQLEKAVTPKRVAYFIWRNPWMSVGNDTFISDVIQTIGWENVLADKRRYPEVSLDELRDMSVDLVLLSSEPYPFKEVHIAEIKEVLPDAQVLLVDGEMFSWYGSRMREATGYFAGLVNSIT